MIIDEKKISKSLLFGWAMGILVFLRTMPCYLWPYEDVVRPICTILVMLICVVNISKERGSFWVFLFLAASYIWAVVFVDHSGIVTLLNFMTFAIIPITRREVILKAYHVYRIFLLITFVLSLFTYALWLLDLAGVGQIIEPLNSVKTIKYLRFPFLVTTYGEQTIRFFSVFDEPGMVGTICGLILVSEQMNLKKKGNRIFLLAGLVTFSFYFYAALILGLIIFSTKLKYRWFIIPVFAALLITTYNNPYMYETVWSRFEWDTDKGEFAGDNRNTSEFAKHYESIVGTQAFFTGEGSEVASEYNNSSSLNLIIVKHGLIFVLLNLMGFAILSFREVRNKLIWLSFFVFFILTLYQRPGFYGVYSISLYTMVIYNFGLNSENTDVK